VTPAEFVAVWERWDEAPSDMLRARAMENACRETAEALGVSTTGLRDALAALRRLGVARDHALRTVRFGVSSIGREIFASDSSRAETAG
jgi:hypothetical protein